MIIDEGDQVSEQEKELNSEMVIQAYKKEFPDKRPIAWKGGVQVESKHFTQWKDEFLNKEFETTKITNNSSVINLDEELLEGIDNLDNLQELGLGQPVNIEQLELEQINSSELKETDLVILLAPYGMSYKFLKDFPKEKIFDLQDNLTKECLIVYLQKCEPEYIEKITNLTPELEEVLNEFLLKDVPTPKEIIEEQKKETIATLEEEVSKYKLKVSNDNPILAKYLDMIQESLQKIESTNANTKWVLETIGMLGEKTKTWLLLAFIGATDVLYSFMGDVLMPLIPKENLKNIPKEKVQSIGVIKELLGRK